ncbi:MAG: histidine kinase [Bacteroidetes bacterium]|nr:histidine kinase [Bacteroidota bacterium]MBS1929824.1 histidine kinase [Bacteroidota bacterium]
MRRVYKYLFIVAIFLNGLSSFISYAQTNEPSLPFPPAYNKLRTDTARMRFLMNTISDSLNSGQLTMVYDMAKEGLRLAEKNQVDTMKGIFYFDLGKAFTYQYSLPDSAIFYYKKVLPYFPDKLRYYNLISMREIMIAFLNSGKKDSAMAYLDSLHGRIDTLAISNPRRYSISSVMATAYQYYGMFRTAISLYENSIEGYRKAGFPTSVGLPMANLAELYDESGDDTNAIKYAREALGYLSNMEFMGTVANLASYYTNLNRNDSARFFNKLADSVGALIHNDEQLHLRGPFNETDILINEKRYNEARKRLSPIKAWIDKKNDINGLIKYLTSLASIDTGLHRWAYARDTLLQALSLARENNGEVGITILLQGLSSVYAKLGDFREAYRYQQEYMQHIDSLTNEKTKSRLADFEAMYKTQKKEESITLLQKNNDIKDLKLKNSKQWNIIYLGGFTFLLIVTGISFYHRNRRLKAQGQKTKADLQMQLFRSQMNPHFIFNSLNSIEYYILQNEKRNASIYLNKFASLIRIILSNNRKDVVPFTEDMQTIQLYVDLELLRFNHSFQYITDIDQALLDADYLVPPLLIQPFVENAIIHGFGLSDKQGLQLKISALLRGEYIVYTIEDNGVGRKKSAAKNALNKPNHNSLGLQITQQRINIFNEQHKANSSLRIEDLYDANQKPCGTRVSVKIKTT